MEGPWHTTTEQYKIERGARVGAIPFKEELVSRSAASLSAPFQSKLA